MIRLITLTIFILFFNFSFLQESKNDKCTVKPFEVYLDDEDTYSNIRDSPKGNIVLKINSKYSYGYILNVIDFKDGWLKINKISGVEEYEISEFEGWIHSSIVGVATTHNIDLFDKPNSKTKVGKLIGEQDTFKIKDVYCQWIKIEYKGVIGWVESEKICGNPVTTCP